MLYLIKSLNLLKIGFTDNPQKRMSQYKSSNPQFELLDLAEGTKLDETYLHTQLQNYKHKDYREWFINSDKVFKVWNNYVSKGNKVHNGYVEYVKPYKRRLDRALISSIGWKILYNEPVYNVTTNKHYRHIQELVDIEKDVRRDIVLEMFTSIRHCPFRFCYPERIINSFGDEESCSMDILYKEIPYESHNQDPKIFKSQEPNSKEIKPWILENLTESEYTYKELEEIFTPLFEEHGLKWNKKTSISYYFPEFVKKKRTSQGVKNTYYQFEVN